jgi:hypothetical protein
VRFEQVVNIEASMRSFQMRTMKLKNDITMAEHTMTIFRILLKPIHSRMMGKRKALTQRLHVQAEKCTLALTA